LNGSQAREWLEARKAELLEMPYLTGAQMPKPSACNDDRAIVVHDVTTTYCCECHPRGGFNYE
jgi:hypothetical protein